MGLHRATAMTRSSADQPPWPGIACGACSPGPTARRQSVP